MTTILLCDNGSSRPQATLQLRKLAKSLSEKTGKHIHPVSLQHANRISIDQLDGKPAFIFTDFIKHQLQQGERDFIVLPLFFGVSKALTSFIPDQVDALKQAHGDFDLKVADVIYPLPGGEPVLTEIILDHINQCLPDGDRDEQQIILVDHGSPIPRVTQVRTQLAETVEQQLPASSRLSQAVMERRAGPEYDFNGDLLTDALEKKASAGIHEIVIILLFFLPGRHAGEGGDIEEICAEVRSEYPDLQITLSPLIAEHPRFVDILARRLEAMSD